MIHLFKSALARAFTYALVTLLVAGLLLGVLRLALPYADHLRGAIAAEVSAATGLDACLGPMAVRLRGWTPELQFHDVRLLDPRDGHTQIAMGRLSIGLDLAASLHNLAPEIRALTLAARWNDTWPVARLGLGSEGGSVLVLAGASGRTLAFGPGHLGSTPLPGAGGNSAIAGHRDTHFAALADLDPGDGLWVEIPGRTLGYRVTETRVVDQAEVGVLADRGHEGLTLITCYPFDALIPGGPLRFVVFAESQ